MPCDNIVPAVCVEVYLLAAVDLFTPTERERERVWSLISKAVFFLALVMSYPMKLLCAKT